LGYVRNKIIYAYDSIYGENVQRFLSIELAKKQNPDSILNWSVDDWREHRKQYLSGWINHWKSERIQTHSSLRIPLKEYGRSKKQELREYLQITKQEIEEMEEPTLQDLEFYVLGKYNQLILYDINDDLTLKY